MKTVVGYFDKFPLAEDAVAQLERAGFERNHISLIAKHEARDSGEGASGGNDDASTEAAGLVVGAGTGATIGGVAGLVLGLAALAIPGIGPVVAAGPLAAAFGSAGVGAAAGGFLGALTGLNIPENDAGYYAEGVRRGGAVLLLRIEDERADAARDAMDRAGASDVQQRGAQWHAESHGFAAQRGNAGEPNRLERAEEEDYASGQAPPALAEEKELQRSSAPRESQLTGSGARIYEGGLEMNPRTSKLSGFK